MFYHLTRDPVEETLTMLLGKAQGAGWRVLVRGTSQERLEWFDAQLWLGPEDCFLPHGLAGGPQDAQQPVLLSTGDARPNGATCVMSVDGARVSPDEVQALERTCVLFDGNDAQALDVARAQWLELKAAGVTAEYWSQDSGRWEKKAQT
jgi:DNA polymerase-3 subunit chi